MFSNPEIREIKLPNWGCSKWWWILFFSTACTWCLCVGLISVNLTPGSAPEYGWFWASDRNRRSLIRKFGNGPQPRWVNHMPSINPTLSAQYVCVSLATVFGLPWWCCTWCNALHSRKCKRPHGRPYTRWWQDVIPKSIHQLGFPKPLQERKPSCEHKGAMTGEGSVEMHWKGGYGQCNTSPYMGISMICTFAQILQGFTISCKTYIWVLRIASGYAAAAGCTGNLTSALPAVCHLLNLCTYRCQHYPPMVDCCENTLE